MTLVSPWCKVIPPQLKGNCANKMVAKSGKVAIAALEQSHPHPQNSNTPHPIHLLSLLAKHTT